MTIKMKFLLRLILISVVTGCANTKVSLVNRINITHENNNNAELNIKFLGNTSLYFQDPRNSNNESVFIDAFLSRPSLGSLLFLPLNHKNEAEISKQLNAAQIDTISYIIPLHSHFDHLLDAPYIASKFKAKLIGSRVTARIAKSMSLDPEPSILEFCFSEMITTEELIKTNEFSVHAETAEHNDTGLGKILAPLKQSFSEEIDFSKPQRASEYIEGDSINVALNHIPTNTIIYVLGGIPARPPLSSDNNLVDFEISDNLKNANIVFFSVPALKELNKLEKQKQNEFWQKLTTDKKLIIPVHWDKFYKKLNKNNCTQKRMNECLAPFQPPLGKLISQLNQEIIKRKAKGAPIDIYWLSAFGEINVKPKKTNNSMK